MASNQLKLFTSVVLLSLACALASDYKQVPAKPKPVEKDVAVVVEGLVYCQSCKRCGTWSLTGAKLISNATVSVICKNYKKRISFYKAFKANENGYFYAELKGFSMSNPILDHPLHACHVKLVSSPQEDCNLLTNVNDGLKGAPLRYENKRLLGSRYEAVVYAAGPLAFHPAPCISKTLS